MTSEGPEPGTRAALERLDVSRETMERLATLAALLRKWQPRINLIGPSTLPTLWHRHILDSAQLLPFLPATGRITDLGSGAGFPGLVLAAASNLPTDLIESDTRKATFLREAARLMGLTSVTVHDTRIEALQPWSAQVLTARAFAPLVRLLPLAAPFLAKDGIALLHKGRDVGEELTEAHSMWRMDVRTHPSLTDPDGIILEIGGLCPVAR